MKNFVSRNHRKARFWGAVLALTCVFGSALSAAEIHNYVQNGTFSAYIYNGATNPALERYGYIRENVANGTVYDSSTNYYIPGWKYVAGNNSGGFGMNGDTITTANNDKRTFSGNGPLPSDPVVFIQKLGTFSTTLSDLVVGQKYVLSYQYSSRPGDGGDLQTYLMAGTDKTVLQGKQYVPCNNANANSPGFFNYHYEFTATATTMEFGLETGYSGADRTTTFSNVSVYKASDIIDNAWRSMSAWYSDATSQVVQGGAYTHAININNVTAEQGLVTTLNGVGFMAAGATNQKMQFNMRAVPAGDFHFGNTTPAVTDAATLEILKTFCTNGPDGVTLEGLIPGFEYEMLIMTSSYQTGGGSVPYGNRTSWLTVNGENRELFNAFGVAGARRVDPSNDTSDYYAKEGITLRWQGKADDDGKIAVTCKTIDGNNTWHFYGMANRVVVAKENLMATGFAGLNGEYNNLDGAVTICAAGTKLDHVNVFGADNTWIGRGRFIDADHISVVDGALRSGGNNGLAAVFNADVIPYDQLSISVDLKIGTLVTDGDLWKGRGTGVGFFDDTIGAATGTQNEVSLGFNGLVVTPGGGLYFLSNMGENAGAFTTTPIAYVGEEAFDVNKFYNLSMDLILNGDGTATLIDVIFGDSTADYSALKGMEFNTLDLIGLLSSSSGSYEHYGYFDNFQVNGVVPEPATWVMLLLGMAGGVVGYRRRGG